MIHFLLNLLDAAEYKKHVHWPLYGKQDETQFRYAHLFNNVSLCFISMFNVEYRSEVLAYMNLLNEKHKLGLEAMKMQVVVFPGGVKFMKIILKLSNFVMSELVRRSNAIYTQ